MREEANVAKVNTFSSLYRQLYEQRKVIIAVDSAIKFAIAREIFIRLGMILIPVLNSVIALFYRKRIGLGVDAVKDTLSRVYVGDILILFYLFSLGVVVSAFLWCSMRKISVRRNGGRIYKVILKRCECDFGGTRAMDSNMREKIKIRKIRLISVWLVTTITGVAMIILYGIGLKEGGCTLEMLLTRENAIWLLPVLLVIIGLGIDTYCAFYKIKEINKL